MDIRKINVKTANGQPVIRVGLFEDQKYVDFIIKEPFKILDLQNNVVIDEISSKLRWRVKIKESVKGNQAYELILFETDNAEEAEKRLVEIKKIDPYARLEVVGGDVILDEEVLLNNQVFRVCSGQFVSIEDAKKAKVNYRPLFNPIVNTVRIKEPTGRIELFDSEYEHSAELENGIKIVPLDPNTNIHLFEIKKYDRFLQKEYFRDLNYNGAIELRFDPKGTLMGVSEAPLEIYLKRAVYSESATGLGKEFYKSLAIAIRSEILSRIGREHVSQPYDFCDWGHCMRYYGEKFSDDEIDQAVLETNGMVLKNESGKLIDANFNTICGGHTEDSHGLFEERTVSSGKVDAIGDSVKETNLENEVEAVDWIKSRPDTFCNLHGRKIPKNLMLTNKYFRWEVFYPRREMRDLIRDKLGVDLGELIDLVPLKRSSSGRIKELELIGTLKSLVIKGELNIRTSLAYDYLESACFYVDKELDENGFPLSFTILGAGQGHGMGMCKAGAAVMGLEGYNYEQIIEHYYNCNCIQRLYAKESK